MPCMRSVFPGDRRVDKLSTLEDLQVHSSIGFFLIFKIENHISVFYIP